LASKRKRQPRASLSCEQASAAPCHFSRLFEHSANQTPNSLASGSLVSKFVDQPRQAKDSANPEDPCPVEKVVAAITCIARFPANAPKRQPSAEFACVWKFRASAAISRILSQQTTYSASLPDPSPTNDSTNLQHVPANDFGSLKLQQTISKILGGPQGKPWPANESANPEDPLSCEKSFPYLTKVSAHR